MQHAYNAYVTKVLEVMTTSALTVNQAKRLCRENLQFLEKSYMNLDDTQVVAQTLLAD